MTNERSEKWRKGQLEIGEIPQTSALETGKTRRLSSGILWFWVGVMIGGSLLDRKSVV